MAQVGIDATVNRWDEPLVLGMVDPHDPLSHPAGVSDVQAESATCLDPDQFSNFLVFCISYMTSLSYVFNVLFLLYSYSFMLMYRFLAGLELNQHKRQSKILFHCLRVIEHSRIKAYVSKFSLSVQLLNQNFIIIYRAAHFIKCFSM